MNAARDTFKGMQDVRNWPLHVTRNAEACVDDSVALHAQVFRLAPAVCGPGFYRHDSRGLRLEKGKLDVFEKRSTSKVKLTLNVKTDVEDCSLLPGNRRLSLSVWRLPPGAEIDAGVWKCKNYFFEFVSADLAAAFHDEIARLMQPPFAH